MTQTLSSRRTGLISVGVLIGLIIIAVICAGLLKVALSRRAEVGINERRFQALWLAESGLERALAKLAKSPDYTGETWEISGEELAGRGQGRVQIQVEPVNGHADQRLIRAVADFPSGSDTRSRQSKQIIIPFTPLAR